MLEPASLRSSAMRLDLRHLSDSPLLSPAVLAAGLWARSVSRSAVKVGNQWCACESGREQACGQGQTPIRYDEQKFKSACYFSSLCDKQKSLQTRYLDRTSQDREGAEITEQRSTI